MRIPALLFALAALLGVAGIGWLAADRGVATLERDTRAQLSQALVAADQAWVNVRPDGLLVSLEGVAPDENARFRVLEIAGQLIDSRRLREDIKILSTQEIATPEFSLQILRNDLEISLIGLIPLDHGRNVILPNLRKLGAGLKLTDMLETAEYDVPDRWKDNIRFALEAAHRLTRTHINVTPDAVSISGVTESVKMRDALSQDLQKLMPAGATLDLDLSAPLPVVNPYRFVAEHGATSLKVSACSLDSDEALARINARLKAAGSDSRSLASCNLALGAPSTDWSTVIETTLTALSSFSGGAVDITDLEVRVTAPKGTPQDDYDTVIATLRSTLPAAYHLTATLPPSDAANADANKTPPPEFSLNLTEDGHAILSGSVRDEPQRMAVATFAASLFGAGRVVDDLELRTDVPSDWTALLLDGLRSANLVRVGQMHITPTVLKIEGRSDQETIGQSLAESLSKLNSESFEVRTSVTFDESLVEIEGELEPATCAQEIDSILSITQISFDPSSAQIAESAQIVIEGIADILKSCPNASFEIGGHTDSQGSEPSNQALSQNRADAVLDALLARDVLIAGFSAVGYGEALPIADNSTEAGREENRRIEFSLLTQPEITDSTNNTNGTDTTAAKDSSTSPTQEASQNE